MSAIRGHMSIRRRKRRARRALLQTARTASDVAAAARHPSPGPLPGFIRETPPEAKSTAIEVVPAFVGEIVTPEPPWAAGARRVMQSFLLRFDGTTLRGYRSDLALLAVHLGLVAPATERAPDQAAMAAGYAVVELLRGGRGSANERVAAWKADMKRAGLKERTVNRRLATVRSMLRVARQLEVIDWTLDVPGFRVEIASDREGPTEEWIARIVVALDEEEGPEAVRDRAVFRLLRCGLRRGELSSRDLEHVRFDRSTITIRGKQRTQDENVTLPAAELEALRAWLEVRGREPGALFVRLHSGKRMTGHDIWKMTRARGKQVFGDEEKLAPVRPHGLRHNAAARGLDLTGGNTAGVASMLRHRDIRVVQTYDDRRQDRGGAVAELLSEDLSKQVAAIKAEKAKTK
jgi:integrase/recombinase XerC